MLASARGRCKHRPPTKAAALLPLHRLFQCAHDECRQQTAAQQSNQESDGVIDHRDEEQPAVGGRAAAAKLHSQRTGQAAACHAGGHHAQRITQRKATHPRLQRTPSVGFAARSTLSLVKRCGNSRQASATPMGGTMPPIMTAAIMSSWSRPKPACRSGRRPC